MAEDDADDEEWRGWLYAAMHPLAAKWAKGQGGLVPMLKSLEASWPHIFAVPAGRLGDAPRPWVPKDDSDKEVERAYKRATYYLHPDRLFASKRDLSVRVEAEEVLKLLTTAHADQAGWFTAAKVSDAAKQTSNASAASQAADAANGSFARSAPKGGDRSRDSSFSNTRQHEKQTGSTNSTPFADKSQRRCNSGPVPTERPTVGPAGVRDEVFGASTASRQQNCSSSASASNFFSDSGRDSFDNPAAAVADDLFGNSTKQAGGSFSNPFAAAESASTPARNPFGSSGSRVSPGSAAQDIFGPAFGGTEKTGGRGAEKTANPFADTDAATNPWK